MSARITVAQLAARTDALEGKLDLAVTAVTQLTELVGTLVQAQAQYATPAAVVTAIADAPSKRTRKAAPAKATKAAPRKAAPKAVEVVTVEEAQARVAAGESAWAIRVASSTTGQPIPFGKVQRALNAQARKDTPKAAKSPVKPTKAVKALGTGASVYFGMSKVALLADGSKGAQAEIARRAAKRSA